MDMMDVHLHSFRQFNEWVVRAASLRHFKKAGLTNILVRYNFKSGIVEIYPTLWFYSVGWRVGLHKICIPESERKASSLQ